VRVLTNADTEGILPFISHAEEFRRDIQCYLLEVIEVKLRLNRGGISQIIAGDDLFAQQYGVIHIQRVIVCALGDAALEWVCQKHKIVVDERAQLPHYAYPIPIRVTVG
jgi:hypothetical protein